MTMETHFIHLKLDNKLIENATF